MHYSTKTDLFSTSAPAQTSVVLFKMRSVSFVILSVIIPGFHLLLSCQCTNSVTYGIKAVILSAFSFIAKEFTCVVEQLSSVSNATELAILLILNNCPQIKIKETHN